MKVRISVLLLCFLPWLSFGAPASSVVLKGQHYAVTSWAGPEAAKTTLDLMEALAARYNSLFLFDLSKAPVWNVTLYATKADFDAALAGQVPTIPQDYVYLQFADPSKSYLAAWVPADGSPTDEVRSLACQGFYQFLWTFLPHPPAWIETGLATSFWNTKWDGKVLTADPDLPFLETLQAKWKDKAPDLKALLAAPEGSLDVASGKDLEAWGLVAFFLEGPDPAYARFFGSALANLSPTATEEANRDAVAQRLATLKDLSAIGADVQGWWKAKVSFGSRIADGLAKLKDKDTKAAQTAFQAALELRPHDDTAKYYVGLAAYEAKDYPAAEKSLAAVDPKGLPPGLLAYARGLTAFALKKNDDAKAFLNQAKTEDEAGFAKLAAPVLELIK
jgi:hypothetical protein